MTFFRSLLAVYWRFLAVYKGDIGLYFICL
jgi:hypothetical protein